MFNLRKWLLDCRAAFTRKADAPRAAPPPITLKQLAFAFEREEIRLEDGTALTLAQEAVNRWTDQSARPVLRPCALYELNSGEYVAIEHAAGKFVAGRKLDEDWALAVLIDMEAELPPKLQQYLDSGEWRNKFKKPLRDLSYWSGKEPLRCEAKLSAHEAKVPELIREIVRAGIVVVQLLRGELNKNGKWTRELRGEFIVALFEQYPVDPDRWWGPRDRIPPATVGILDLPWPVGTDEMRVVVRDMQALVEPPLACMCYCGRRIDNPDAPTYEEQQAAEEVLRLSAPLLEQLIVRLQGHLEALVTGKTIEKLQDEKIVRIPSSDAFLAYVLREITGATQKQIAKMIAGATGGTTEQGTVSRWLKEVDHWVAQSNHVPTPDFKLIGKAISVDPSVIDLGARQDARTPRHREERDDS